MSLAAGISGQIRLFPLFLVASSAVLIIKSRNPVLVVCYGILMCSFYIYGRTSTLINIKNAARCLQIAMNAQKNGDKKLAGWVSGYPIQERSGTRITLNLDQQNQGTLLPAKIEGFDIQFGEKLLITKWDIKKRRHNAQKKPQNKNILENAWHVENIIVRVKVGDYISLPEINGDPAVRCVFWPLHRELRNCIKRNLGANGAVPLALLLGEKSALRIKTKNNLQVLGISHLFALSGLHLGLIAALILWVFKKMKLRSRLLLIAFLYFYISVVGDIPSLKRAYVMMLFGAFALKVQRAVSLNDIIAAAAMVLLLMDPGSLNSIGLQLSFVATYAVLLSITGLKKRNKTAFLRIAALFLLFSLRASIYAQAFTLPLSLKYFGKVSIMSPIATIVFLPMVIIMIILSAAAAITELCFPYSGGILFNILDKSVDIFDACLNVLAAAAPKAIHAQRPCELLYYPGIWLCLSPNKNIWARLAGIALAAVSLTLGRV